MALVDDLLADGTVIQDPEDADKVIFNVPVYVKKAAVNAGGFEAFAGEYGWAPMIKDEDGNDIVNPMTVYEKCQRIIWAFVTEVFKAAMFKQAEKQAREQAQTAVEALI